MTIELLVKLTDEELNAFVDGALDPIRSAAIAASIFDDSATDAALRAYRSINMGLQALYGAIIDEPIPARLLDMLAPNHSGSGLRRTA